MLKTSRFSKTNRGARRHLITALPALMLLAMLVMVPGAVSAASPLDAPRDAGIVGERYDGLAAIHDEGRADGQIRAMVKDINDQRRAFYAKQATEEGVKIEAIARIYARTIFKKAPSGWWFLLEDGNWRQK
jgi:uncharacterized protein YdbL (DUF1318 family)